MDLWLSPHDARARSLRNPKERESLLLGWHASPFGPCAGLSNGTHLLALRFETGGSVLEELGAEWPGITLTESAEATSMVAAVFENPEAVPILATGTPFQLTVWEYLRRSGNASTMTYGEVARSIGRPTAARAVGQAVGANPLAVAIPCHRVISKGKLTGYRWGLDRKKALLAWELSRRDPLKMPF
jgi:AraC family transcriptional regulator, regulatory protein of adaptative response / methylated-DNA-[protein]-cysteine methyltransferase